MALPLSGFTIVRNAIRLDFPVVESIRSLLPLCEEIVVNVGKSDDATMELVRSVDDPRVQILEREWDFARREHVLSSESHRAMRACRHDWGVYIQADEVLHESGIPLLREAIEACNLFPVVEGLVVRYHHFFGDPFIEAVNRRWYRREVRAVRLDPALHIHPFRDAQGFRVGHHHRKVRARLTEAEMFHYGWTRSADALRGRRQEDRKLYAMVREPGPEEPVLRWIPGLRRFRGTHPGVARDWVAAHRDDPGRTISAPRFRLTDLRFYASDLIERITGEHPFEFRNYTLV